MLTDLLEQGAPRGAEGQEVSKMLPGAEERAPGYLDNGVILTY